MSIEKSVIFANQSKPVLETSFWDTSKVLSSTLVNFLERLLELVYFVCPMLFFLEIMMRDVICLFHLGLMFSALTWKLGW
jgi:hypothetical protein